jgi:hypothetical protein
LRFGGFFTLETFETNFVSPYQSSEKEEKNNNVKINTVQNPIHTEYVQAYFVCRIAIKMQLKEGQNEEQMFVPKLA